MSVINSLSFLQVVIILTVSSLIFWLLIRRRPTKHKKIPGPKGWPLIGNILDLPKTNVHHTLTELAKQYGGIYEIHLFGERNVVLSDLEGVREATIGEPNATASADRPDTFTGKYIRYNYSDVGFGKYNGTIIKLRKLFHKLVNLHGDGRQSIEKIVTDEMKRLINKIEAYEGGNFDPDSLIQDTLCHMSAVMLLGSRFDDGHPNIEAMKKFGEITTEIFLPGNDALLETLPFLRLVPCRVGRLFKDVIKSRDKFVNAFVTYSKSTYIPGKVRGFIDDVITVQQKEIKEFGSSWLNDDHLNSIVLDMATAGILTTRASLSGLLLVLLHHEDIQEKLYQDIERVIGHDRSPLVSDRVDMPYTDAVLWELLRYTSHSPLALPHKVTADITIKGYHVPKGTNILINLWALQHDESLWDDPWSFRPERFLTDNGELLKMDHPTRKNYAAFGFGKRNCPAEQFARSRIFLVITSLLQNFKFCLPENADVPPSDPRKYVHGVVLHPDKFLCRVIPRSGI